MGPGGPGGGFGGGASVERVLSYVSQHGGGTIAVSSQSSAASAIIEKGADVAGIGGFSGRESDVSVSWLAQEVRAGKIRWVLAESGGSAGAGQGRPGDNRAGSRAAMAAAARACVRVTLPAAATGAGSSSGAAGGGAASILYDCQGRATEIAAAGQVAS